VQFLQGMLTNDVKSLEKHNGMRAAFLTSHGKIRALCVILNLGDGLLILNDPQTHEKVYKQVFPFTYAGDFVIEDVSAAFQTLSLQGPRSLLILKEVCFEPLPELNEYELNENSIAGHRTLVVRRSRTGEPGYDILVSADGIKDVWEFILLKGSYHSIAPVGHRALNILRIEAGTPVYGVDIDENNMLLEAGLDDVASFTKGCYTGQEAVAMATYRGHVSKKFSTIMIDKDATIQIGDKIEKIGKEIGTISSIAYSSHQKKTIALALIKYGFFEDGTEVQVKTEHGDVIGIIKEKSLKR
jgi:folate-binding protein YgfZ